MDKNELKKIITLDDRINSKIRQLEDIRCTMESVRGIDYSKDNVQTDPVNAIENTIIKIMEYENCITEDIDRLVDMKEKARKKINKVEGTHGTILEMRYLECMRWEEIAYRLKYGIRHVHKLHGGALEELKKKDK